MLSYHCPVKEDRQHPTCTIGITNSFTWEVVEGEAVLGGALRKEEGVEVLSWEQAGDLEEGRRAGAGAQMILVAAVLRWAAEGVPGEEAGSSAERPEGEGVRAEEAGWSEGVQQEGAGWGEEAPEEEEEEGLRVL